MKRTLIAAVTIFLTHIGYSQKSNPHKLSFSSINQAGVATGAQRDAIIFQTINGVALKDWSAGIGVGIDGYSERSIPLFIDLRKSFGSGNNIPFVYVDGGINFGWLNFIQRESSSFPEYKQPSWYYDTGLGWKIPLGTKTAFLLTAGYSLKQLNGDRRAFGPVMGGQITEYREKFENTYRRLIIKLGVQL
jgi:hypothetical protein